MKNEATIGGVTVAGQPTDGELRVLRERGYSAVINVRMPEEQSEPERPKVMAEGLQYASVPYTAATISVADVHAIRQAIAEAPDGKILLH